MVFSYSAASGLILCVYYWYLNGGSILACLTGLLLLLRKYFTTHAHFRCHFSLTVFEEYIYWLLLKCLYEWVSLFLLLPNSSHISTFFNLFNVWLYHCLEQSHLITVLFLPYWLFYLDYMYCQGQYIIVSMNCLLIPLFIALSGW